MGGKGVLKAVRKVTSDESRVLMITILFWAVSEMVPLVVGDILGSSSGSNAIRLFLLIMRGIWFLVGFGSLMWSSVLKVDRSAMSTSSQNGFVNPSLLSVTRKIIGIATVILTLLVVLELWIPLWIPVVSGVHLHFISWLILSLISAIYYSQR